MEGAYGSGISMMAESESWKLEGLAVAIGPGGSRHEVTRYSRTNLGTAINGTQVMVWFDHI